MPKKAKGSTKTIIVTNVPVRIHTRFKAQCAKRDIAMRAVLLRFMEGYGKVQPDEPIEQDDYPNARLGIL